MTKQHYIGVVRLCFGLLGLAAITTQLFTSIELGRSIPNFFSFFTIQSNILVALLLLLIGFCNLKGITGNIAFLRGAATLYIAMTGVIYFLLLSGNNEALQTTIPWVNIVLHYLMPIAVVADWIFFPAQHNVPFKRAVLWLIYPFIYMVYSFIRGAITGWYPYPFLNPTTTGWPTVAAISLIIAIATIGLTWLLVRRTPKAPRQR